MTPNGSTAHINNRRRALRLAAWMIAANALLMVPRQVAGQDCNGQVASFTGEGNCSDRISCEPQRCEDGACKRCDCDGNPNCPCTSCSCFGIRCECPNGSIVNSVTCATNSCNQCGGIAASPRGQDGASSTLACGVASRKSEGPAPAH
jgi:hypothetical protein